MSLLAQYPQLKIIQNIALRQKVSVYLVGGFLRDFLLDQPKMDFDFAVEKNALRIARALARKIKGAYVLLDEAHGCARVVKKYEGAAYTFDFADFRAKTFRQDLSHRDFTINTFSINLAEVSDHNGIKDVLKDLKKGKRDLQSSTIRMVSKSIFKEDPLRMLRAFSLQAVLGFKIEAKTLAQIKKDKELIREVSYERITVELFKIFESNRAAQNLKAMDRIGLLEQVIPQIRVMYGCKQGTYHHLDVWPHSLESVDQLEKLLEELKEHQDIRSYLNEILGSDRSRRALLKLAMALHDICKPDTRKKEDNGRISFHGHEHVGKNIVRHIVKLLKLSTRERHILEDIVEMHLRPGYLSNFKAPSERAIFRFFRDAKDEAASILLLSLADQRSTRGPMTTEADQRHHEKICMSLIGRYFDMKKEKPFVRLIDGNDLIRKLKLKPSPLFSKILSEVDEKQMLGKITTKQEALGLAEKIADKGL